MNPNRTVRQYLSIERSDREIALLEGGGLDLDVLVSGTRIISSNRRDAVSMKADEAAAAVTRALRGLGPAIHGSGSLPDAVDRCVKAFVAAGVPMKAAPVPTPAAILTQIVTAVGESLPISIEDRGDHAVESGAGIASQDIHTIASIACEIGLKLDPDECGWEIVDDSVPQADWLLSGATVWRWKSTYGLPVEERPVSVVRHPDGFAVGYRDGSSRVIDAEGRPVD